MRNVNTLTRMLVAVAALGLCFPPAAFSATTPAKPKVDDVAMLKGNVLVGQLVSPDGKGVSGAKVLLQRENRTIATMKTDKQGLFAAKGVPGGVYRIAAGDTQGVYRVWAPKTAPPTAQKGALLVKGNGVVRAQYGSALRNMLANPWIVAGIVACAVAIPVAVHNASGGDSPISP